MVLDLDEVNYGQWRLCFLVIFTKFGLFDHINSSDTEGTSEWLVLLQNVFGYASYLLSSVAKLTWLQLCIVTMSLPFTWQVI
jgi:hypothetical protein